MLFRSGTRYKFSWFGKYGEYSYGIYLWSFPIQQIVVYYFGGSMNVFTHIVITIPISIIFGIISYYLVEKTSIHAYKQIRLKANN